MNCFECIIGHFRKTSNKDVEEYNAKIAKEVQNHWKDSTLAIKELVKERWTDVSDGEHQKDFNYVVFIDIAGDLDWLCDDDHSEKTLKRESSALLARALSIEAAPCKQLSEQERMSFKKILGAAMVSAFEESYDDAETLMAQAQTFLRQRTEERSRKWMLFGSTVLMFALALLMRLCFNANIRTPSLFGLLGAYVSIVGHSGTRQANANAGKPLHWLEALVRLVVGMILGNIGVEFFKCPLAPELGRELCVSDAGLKIVAFVSGLIDAFIPSMISAYILLPLNSKGESHD